MNPRVAVLASGEGTTAEAAAKIWAKDPDAPRIELIITNNPDAGILKRLPAVESAVINSKNSDDVELAILKKLRDGKFDLIWLTGYMKKVGPKLVHEFGWRSDYTSPYQAMMLNTHPGLLPATKGLMGADVQQYVLDHPGQKAGHTLHVVSDNYDEGPIVTEHEVPVKKDDTAEMLFERVKQSERRLWPEDIANFIKQRQKNAS